MKTANQANLLAKIQTRYAREWQKAQFISVAEAVARRSEWDKTVMLAADVGGDDDEYDGPRYILVCLGLTRTIEGNRIESYYDEKWGQHMERSVGGEWREMTDAELTDELNQKLEQYDCENGKAGLVAAN